MEGRRQGGQQEGGCEGEPPLPVWDLSPCGLNPAGQQTWWLLGSRRDKEQEGWRRTGEGDENDIRMEDAANTCLLMMNITDVFHVFK